MIQVIEQDNSQLTVNYTVLDGVVYLQACEVDEIDLTTGDSGYIRQDNSQLTVNCTVLDGVVYLLPCKVDELDLTTGDSSYS